MDRLVQLISQNRVLREPINKGYGLCWLTCMCYGTQVLRRHYSHQADIWSCGVILYILLSGVPPFWGESEQQIFDCILKGNLDFQSDPWPQISHEAKDCVKQMLQQVSAVTVYLCTAHCVLCQHRSKHTYMLLTDS